jgi:hypothetical protein
MVADPLDLQEFAHKIRFEFADGLPDPCQRPRLAGLGLSLSNRLAVLLTQHGVSEVESAQRASADLKSLGEEGVSRALAAANPWRELKWLANQLRPPYMLIKPSELQVQVSKRQADRPVGHKKLKQAKGKGKGVPPSASVDPSLLRLEHGIFQSDHGQGLSQLPLPQIGPNAAGVAVVSAACVEPYLKAPNPFCQLVHWLSLWLMLRVLCLPRFRSLLSVSLWSVLQMVSLCLLMAFFSNLVQSGFRGLQFSKDVKFFPSQPAW